MSKADAKAGLRISSINIHFSLDKTGSRPLACVLQVPCRPERLNS